MFNRLTKESNEAVQNNVAHATVTTNAWRDAVDMIPKVNTHTQAVAGTSSSSIRGTEATSAL